MKAVKAVEEERYDVWAQDGERVVVVSNGHSLKSAEALAKAKHNQNGLSYFVRPTKKRDTKFVLSPPKETAMLPEGAPQKKQWQPVLIYLLANVAAVVAAFFLGKAVTHLVLK